MAKIFYLKYTEDDFTKSGQDWDTDPIYLYSNSQYKNYSALKSKYGTDLIGNDTWTGMADEGGGVTESGFTDSGRFVDTTGQIDVTKQKLEVISYPGIDTPEFRLSVYTHDNPAEDLDYWRTKTGISSHSNIYEIGVQPYLKLAITWNDNIDPDQLSIEYYVEIRIHDPVPSPLYESTRFIMDAFPEWMDLRSDSLPSATPSLATPVSVGGKLINAVAGEDLEGLRTEMDYVKNQTFLTLADANQADWIYVAESIPKEVYSITGDGTELTHASNVRDFYKHGSSEDVCLYAGPVRDVIWTRKSYTTFQINGTTYNLVPLHTWNWFDEHAAAADLYRLYLEDNESLRQRILDLGRHPLGSSKTQIQFALRRELDLWDTMLGATPHYDTVGATPEIYDIAYLNENTDYFTSEGLPTQRMRDVVDYINEHFPTVWGYFKFGHALWNVAGANNDAYNILPNQFDATPSDDLEAIYSYGVGDLNDLYLFKPDEYEQVIEFEYRFKAKAMLGTESDSYPAATTQVSVKGKADTTYYYDQIDAFFTVWVTVAGTRYWSNVNLDSGVTKSYTTLAGVDREVVSLGIIDESGYLRKDLTWGVDGVATTSLGGGYDDTHLEAEVADIQALEIQWGWDYDYASTTPTNAPAAGYGTITLETEDPVTTLAANAVGTKLAATEYDAVVTIIADWDNSGTVAEEYVTSSEVYDIEMNGLAPNNQKNSYVLPAPFFMWPTTATNKVWEFEVITYDTSGDPTVYTQDEVGDALTIPITDLELDGSTAWTDGKQEVTYDEGSNEITFSTVDNGTYPITHSDWTVVTAYSNDTYTGIVDENGAWLNGVEAPEGERSDRLVFHSLARTDFGLPETDDHVVTWIGVELVSAADVSVWIDTNTVEPANRDVNVTYPESAITEVDNGGAYQFEGFYVYARRKEPINPRWNPYIHSGWMYNGTEEYYLYANKGTATAATPSYVLPEQANFGAPLIVRDQEATPNLFRQVAFIESLATPTLTGTNTEVVSGTGTSYLYLSFEDIYDVTVIHDGSAVDITLDTESESNAVEVSETTSFDDTYTVTYKVEKSFIVNHEYVDDDSNLVTQLTFFEATPTNAYDIVFESADYNLATPVDVPLNPLYTLQDEGFIYISFDEYDFGTVNMRLNPGALSSSDQDYSLLTIEALDTNGNPKPETVFTLSTDWGTLGETTLTTDIDGFASTTLTGEASYDQTSGAITVFKDAQDLGDLNFAINLAATPTYKVVAMPTADAVPADNATTVSITGRVISPGATPVEYAIVNYRTGGSIKEVIEAGYTGQYVSNEKGIFHIGPFTTDSDPRDVFYVVESWEQGSSPSGPVGSPNYANPAEYGPVGDVVVWREYPIAENFVNELNFIPQGRIIYDPAEAFFMSDQRAFPTGFDEATPNQDATPSITYDWETPKWYPISAYKQYQLGLRGDTHYTATYFDENSHPDYKDY